MMPWGDLGEGGGFGPLPGSLTPFTQPFVKDTIQQITNHDNFWDKPIVDENLLAGKSGIERLTAEGGTRAKHLASSLLPTPFIDAKKIYDAAKDRPDYKGRMRDSASVLMDVGLGIKTYPVDYAEQMTRKIMELDPKKGILAREIKAKIKSAARKRNTITSLGQSGEYYDKRIQAYVEQLRGLGEELKGVAQTFGKTK
jgi:hypothetical protein